MKFQMDLALSIIEAGILLDTNGADPKLLKDKANRPSFMRQDGFHPCGCGVCFFCKHKLTHGVEHKSWHHRGYQAAAPASPSKHPKVPQPMGSGPCIPCLKRAQQQEKYKHLGVKALLKEKARGKLVVPRCTKGCQHCINSAGNPGVRVCSSCWSDYTHT